jgi:phage-related protein
MPSQTVAGLNMKQNQAAAGDPSVNASRDMLTATARGDYLDPTKNPNYANMMNDVAGRVNNQFSRPGAFGGSAHQELLTKNLGQVGNQMYDAERTNQLRAGALSPQMQNAGYQNAEQMLGVGDIYGQRQQDLLNMNYQNWQEMMNYPYKQLDVLSNTLAGATGGRSTSYQEAAPVQYNRAANAAGLGLMGGALGTMGPQFAGGYTPYLTGGAGALGGYLM